MIMAQHPQKHSQGSDCNAKASSSRVDIATKQLREKADRLVAEICAPQIIRKSAALTSNEINTNTRSDKTSVKLYSRSCTDEKQQQQHQRKHDQDGKRTLIKNQLYLIEQLQLENANLRNERDHLQLENEELKFQLQMISSSTILGQSSNAFDVDRQLEKLVENENWSGLHATASNCTTVENVSSTQPQKIQQSDGSSRRDYVPSHSSHMATAGLASGYNHLSQPVITTNSDSSPSKAAATPLRYLSSLDCRRLGSSNGGDSSTMSILSKAQNLKVAASNRLTDAKVNSSSSWNVYENRVPSPLSTKDDNHDASGQDADELIRKMIAHKFHGDSERVDAAAIVIQRAFREYQICKRFRTITEQLRQACQSSPTNQQKESHLRNVPCESDHHYQELVCRDVLSNPMPYASGATRAAGWESSSQSASRLVMSAASTNMKSSGVAKSTSYQQVSLTNANQQPRQPKVTLATTPMVGSDRGTHFKDKSVVAAALNFQQLESLRKRQYRVGLNVFNKNPEHGVSYLIAHSFIDCTTPFSKTSTSYYLSNQLHFIDKQQLTARQQSITSSLETATKMKSDRQTPSCRFCIDEENLKRNAAHFLLHRKGLAKEKIGQYLGNLQSQFNQDVLRYYLQELDFSGLQVDVALRKFSATMRMPGEAQKIECFVDYFAQRYVQCQQLQALNEFLTVNTNQTLQLPESCVSNKNNLPVLSKDEIFILTFAIIMLNTDLHSPSLKSSSRMSASQFVNNLRGVFKSQTINECDLVEIYERVKANQITTTPDHVTHVMKVQQGLTTNNFRRKELPNLCMPHRRLVCFCRLFEVYDINKKERAGQHQREIFLFNDMLLVTKLSRRARANTPQQYIYRQSISLQGLYVQLFQSTYYNFGIRLCQRTNNETLIMFNARNGLDQNRFVDDLNESIAEMDEMDAIRANNLVESLHYRHLERLRRHALLHSSEQNMTRSTNNLSEENLLDRSKTMGKKQDDESKILKESEDDLESSESTDNTVIKINSCCRMTSKFNSMSNLASVAEVDTEDCKEKQYESNGLPNKPFVEDLRRSSTKQNLRGQQVPQHETSASRQGPHRSQSANSIHSLDSGLFLSRDVSPNQSA